mmetsp:Transcript_10011/g.12015  ORF Transcript_10011/g.12015 Transcript_10011/m.12015 type:complete len:80 (+) Transcript_10011:569-808(+)
MYPSATFTKLEQGAYSLEPSLYFAILVQNVDVGLAALNGDRRFCNKRFLGRADSISMIYRAEVCPSEKQCCTLEAIDYL